MIDHMGKVISNYLVKIGITKGIFKMGKCNRKVVFHLKLAQINSQYIKGGFFEIFVLIDLIE